MEINTTNVAEKSASAKRKYIRSAPRRESSYKITSFNLPPDLTDRLEKFALAQDVSRSWILRKVVRSWLDEHAPEAAE